MESDDLPAGAPLPADGRPDRPRFAQQRGDRRWRRRSTDRRGADRTPAGGVGGLTVGMGTAGELPGERGPDGPDLGRDDGPDDGPAGAAARSGRSRIVRAVLAVGLLLAAYYLLTLFQVWSAGRSDQAAPADAIVVLGAAQYDGRPSPQLAARLDHAIALWPEGFAPLLIVTGGNRPGDRFTEAEASAAYLADRGVPASAIVLEDGGSTTYESLESVARMLAGRGDRVLIVTDPYHALRSRLIAEEVGLDARVSATGTSVVTGWQSLRRHFQEAAGVAIGRVIGFDRLSRLTN